MKHLLIKEFNVKAAIEYLEFWKFIDGSGKLMIIWSQMGEVRTHRIIVSMGHTLKKIDSNSALSILNYAFSKAGIEKTRDLMLELFREEIK